MKVEGRGVFIVALNNRIRLERSSSRVKVSTTELKTLKPLNVSMYNLRIGLELVSSIKDKLYQLLLFLKEMEFSVNKETNRRYEIKYKTIGNLDSISIYGE